MKTQGPLDREGPRSPSRHPKARGPRRGHPWTRWPRPKARPHHGGTGDRRRRPGGEGAGARRDNGELQRRLRGGHCIQNPRTEQRRKTRTNPEHTNPNTTTRARARRYVLIGLPRIAALTSSAPGSEADPNATLWAHIPLHCETPRQWGRRAGDSRSAKPLYTRLHAINKYSGPSGPSAARL